MDISIWSETLHILFKYTQEKEHIEKQKELGILFFL